MREGIGRTTLGMPYPPRRTRGSVSSVGVPGYPMTMRFTGPATFGGPRCVNGTPVDHQTLEGTPLELSTLRDNEIASRAYVAPHPACGGKSVRTRLLLAMMGEVLVAEPPPGAPGSVSGPTRLVDLVAHGNYPPTRSEPASLADSGAPGRLNPGRGSPSLRAGAAVSETDQPTTRPREIVRRQLRHRSRRRRPWRTRRCSHGVFGVRRRARWRAHRYPPNYGRGCAGRAGRAAGAIAPTASAREGPPRAEPQEKISHSLGPLIHV